MATCSGDMGPAPLHRDQTSQFISTPLITNKNLFNAGQVVVDGSLKKETGALAGVTWLVERPMH